MTWLCANSEAVTSELEYIQQLDPDNFLKYFHASDIDSPSNISHSHRGLSIDDFCSRANDIAQTIKARHEHCLLCIYLFLMTHDFSLDFPNGDLLVFKDTGNKTPNGHVMASGKPKFHLVHLMCLNYLRFILSQSSQLSKQSFT